MRVQNSVSPPTFYMKLNPFSANRFSFIVVFQSIEPTLSRIMAGQMAGDGCGVHCLSRLCQGPLVRPLSSLIADGKVIFEEFCQLIVSPHQIDFRTQEQKARHYHLLSAPMNRNLFASNCFQL